MLPNFLGIGAQRAGTTWVYNCLREHPDVFVPEKKELQFFSWHYQEGLTWYEAYFSGHAGEKAVGEVTPNYLNVPGAIPRIAQLLPKARLFVILRNPVDRARSSYRLLRESKYQGLTFHEACKHYRYLINLGMYAAQMEHVYSHFDQEHVKVFLYDDLQRDPREFLSKLFAFLGVNPAFQPPSTNERYNQVRYASLQDFLVKAGAGRPLDSFKRSPIGQWLKRRYARKPDTARTSMTASEEELSLKAKFHGDVLRLQDILKRDLSAWL